MRQAVLVTGATGFLGRSVVRELCAEHEVHALVRPTADRTPLDDLQVTWHAGDLTDPPSVEAALAALAATAARARELGWAPTPFELVLLETIRHLHQNGHL